MADHHFTFGMPTLANATAEASSGFLPLRGVRVVSLALNLPGPAALWRLRRLGAECLKVEPPPPSGAPPGSSGDPAASVSRVLYDELHEGIRVHCLDLKDPTASARLDELLAGAALLLTSFRPRALARLGLSWAQVSSRHPALSMVAIVGAPAERADEPGHDLTYQAEAGLVRGVDLPVTVFADMGGALLATEAALGVLLAARTTGRGAYAEVALSDAAHWLAKPIHWGLLREGSLLGGGFAGYRVYTCRDGRVALAAVEPHFARALCEWIGLDSRGASALMAPDAHRRVAQFFADKDVRTVEREAALRDIPLHAIPAAPDAVTVPETEPRTE